MKKGIIITAATMGLFMQALAATVIDYQHDDAAGTKLKNLLNDGYDQTGWNYSQPFITADGDGNLQVGAVTNASVTKFFLASPLTNGYAELEYRIDGYDMTGLAHQSSFGIEFWPAGATWQLATKMRLEVNDSNPNGIKLSAPRPTAYPDTVGYPSANLDSFASTTGITYKVELDLDAGTFEVKYKLDTDADFSVFGPVGVCTNLAEVRLVLTHKSDWGTTNFVDVDYIKLTTSGDAPAYPGDVWQFNDVAGKRWPELAKESGAAAFNWFWESPKSDGLGALNYIQDPALTNGGGRQANATGMPAVSTGKVELKYKMLQADLSGGDASGAMVSFGFRDNTVNKDLFAIRLYENNGNLQLQSRVSGEVNSDNVVHYNFGTNVVDQSMDIRILADMDTDTFDVFYTLEGGSEVNATNNMPMGTAGLTFNDFKSYATVNTNDYGPSDFISFDYLSFIPVQEVVVEPTYEGWLSQFPALGSETNEWDNPDGDALNNFYEYALGGNPSDPADVGYVPTYRNVEDHGNWIEYVYAKRNDADVRGLNYYLASDTDLVVAPGWVAADYEVLGTNVGYAVGFDAVTNRVSTDLEDTQFIKLIVEEL
ncbi:hypothetical protein [Pontiella agarivorans]|uniref:Uncharacterized protein n=1 Tax=Pontiella agarivorans TaxID=3038953 RepID=A0ABU5MY17_9BACT|nr:hypothetical protein [Pontiella agarivorans]MDZ8119070.1 hypothetical protein [Pontiella agarivorans]